ncbi:N-acyl homoserine lactonase family protein [Pseudonocardia xinjiangensis]|uniref:N-acyl homoserine lactonase family protein n=1 Tax=Pseudonocardia xinjiangensis TaxID=75289 RepID=UPI003D8B0726
MSGYEVLAVRYGTRLARKAENYLNFHVYGEPDEDLPMDYFFWVVRDGDRTIVVDCGFSAEAGRRRGRTQLADPGDALMALGIDPGSVSQLVVTHAHYDHIGNLERFPAAEIVIARREYEFWTGPYAARPQFAHSTEAIELDRLAAAGEQGRLRLVEKTLDLAPGFELVVVGGHTPGQLVAQVAVDGEDGGPGAVILAADALHFYEELERDRPFFVVADLVDMYRGFDLLREMSADPGRLLLAGHDAAVPDRFPGRLPDMPGDLTDLVVRVAGRTRTQAEEVVVS